MADRRDNESYKVNSALGFASIVLDADLGLCRGIYVGTAGDVSVTPANGGSAVVFKSVPAGTILPIHAQNVTTANTTASNMVALY
jgi:hypothetical protein